MGTVSGETIFNNLLALIIIIFFFLFIYSQIKKQSISEVIKEFIEMIRGKKDEGVIKGGLWRRQH